MLLTIEQVLALAPDAASATAGRGLASAAKWLQSGANNVLLWGEAQGSGKTPYQTVVDVNGLATKCSCPSRKFPCKHALGLLIRYARNEVGTGEPPAWATEWLEKRGAKPAPKAPAQTDPKTVERRWAAVLKGLDECEAFLHDAVESGLLALASARTWDEMAKRMVDAQAPGVARRLRRIGGGIGVGSDWAPRVAAEVGSLGLLVEAVRRVETLGDLAHDVRAALGIPTRKEEAEEVVNDVWDVVGAFGNEEDRLWTRRTWFRGRESGRWALQLAFAPAGGAPPPPTLPYGAAIAAEARFSPSAWPLRAHLEDGEARSFAPAPGGAWATAFEEQAGALAHNPWIDLFPVLLRDAVLAPDGERWLVVDAEGIGVPISNVREERERLLARTGNVPCEIFGEFDGKALSVVSYREVDS